jgi:cobalt-zinc-cadmium efflux system membrane fusion protein
VSPPPGTRPPPLFPPGTRIRFRNPRIERDAGLTWVPAIRARLSRRVHTTARIDYNRDRLAEIRSPVPALVQRVRVELGAKVTQGAKLLTLSSARIGELKSRLVAATRGHRVARANLKRQQALHRRGGASAREVELARLRLAEAASRLAATHQSLRVGGISARGSAGTFTLLSPIAGTVVKRPAVLGAQAGPGTSLAVVADTRTMWALLDVTEWDAARVRPGQPVRLQVAGLSGQPVPGRITWVSTAVDPRTRYVQARARVQNPEGRLRANQFARATIVVGAPRGEVTVPRAAVQRLGNGHVVFVRREAGLYEPRRVRPGRSEGERVHVKGALRPGEAVVTTGAFLLRTELDKDAIGAGCCEVERPGSR